MKLLKRKQKIARPSSIKPASAWKMFRAALLDLKHGWKRYVLIMAIVAVPMNLFLLAPGLSTDPAFQAYSLIFLVIMNVALLWAISTHERTGQVPGLAAAYYDGSIAIVRFLLTMLALVLMLIPVTFATVLYILGSAVVDASGTLPEQMLILFACLLISMISGWLIVRFGLAPIIVVADGTRPVHALRYARTLTLGRFWRVFARMAALVLFVAITALPIAAVTALLSALHLAPLATLFFELITTFTALPLINIYGLRLYRDLEKGYHSVNERTTSTAAATIDK